jgi:hypothetical protein
LILLALLALLVLLVLLLLEVSLLVLLPVVGRGSHLTRALAGLDRRPVPRVARATLVVAGAAVVAALRLHA